MTNSEKRNAGIDLLRLLGSLFVIILHVSFYRANGYGAVLARLSARWAVPVFFIVSGYFFVGRLHKSPDHALKENLKKLLPLIVISNLIFLVINLLEHQPLFPLTAIFFGDYYHLWFLFSLLIGVCIIYMLHRLRANAYVETSVMIIILFSVLTSGAYNIILPIVPASSYVYFRSFLSVPFMLFGAAFGTNKMPYVLRSMKAGLVLVIGGCLLQAIEIFALRRSLTFSIYSIELLVGVIPLAIGIFVAGLNLKMGDNILSSLGKKYSLFIYLYHPIMIFIIDKSRLLYYINGNILFILPLCIFLLTLLLAIIFDSYFHLAFALLNGRFEKRKPLQSQRRIRP